MCRQVTLQRVVVARSQQGRSTQKKYKIIITYIFDWAKQEFLRTLFRVVQRFQVRYGSHTVEHLRVRVIVVADSFHLIAQVNRRCASTSEDIPASL